MSRLHKALKRKKITVSELSKRLEISKPSVYNKLSSRTEWTVSEIHKISLMLELPIGDVVKMVL